MTRKLTLSLLLALFTATAALAAEPTSRYLVATRTAPQLNKLRVQTEAATRPSRRVHAFENFPAMALDLTEAEAEELRRSGQADIVEPVYERYALESGNGLQLAPQFVNYNQQVFPWGVKEVKSEAVWTATRGANVNVAVLDTGIDYTHPDLKGNYVDGANVYKLDPGFPAIDDHRHGTHVAGIIGAQDNLFGVLGVAPGVKLWSVKALDSEGRGTTETVARGIDWVITKSREVGGRWVINMSLGSKFAAEVERLACTRALAEGIVLVAASGNANATQLSFPAGHTGVIAVGAHDAAGDRASFSSYGNGLHILAPGVAVPSTLRVGINTKSDIEAVDGSVAMNTDALDGSGFGTVTGRLVDCGFGRPEDMPLQVAGNICVMKRGENVFFRSKARNAKEAGAIGAVIFNAEDGKDDLDRWTMLLVTPCEVDCEVDWANYKFPVTVGLEFKEGTDLKKHIGKTMTLSHRQEDYGLLSGTSMATPHVAGAVALMLALAPDLTPAQVELVLAKTAIDIAEPGWDFKTGWGRLDALAAAKYVAPGAFGLPPTDPVPPGKRRSTRN